MARIAGVDLPREKRVEIGLTYIYGIGRVSSNKILEKAGVNPDVRVRDLTDDDVKKISAIIDEEYIAHSPFRGCGYLTLWTSDENIRFQPLTDTNKSSLKGVEIMAGGSMIMPMLISVEETTTSISINGIYSSKPV